MAITVSLDLAFTVNRTHLLTPSPSSGARSPLCAGPTTTPGRDDGYDWKASTLAALRAQQSTAVTDESAGAAAEAGTTIANSVTAEETATFIRNQILNDVTTALRAHTNVFQVPLDFLR